MTASPRSYADYKDLAKLAAVTLEASCEIKNAEEENIALIKVKNSSGDLAFMVHLATQREKDGIEISPTFWSDNYFSLLPGESKIVTARYYSRDTEGSPVQVKIDGWNIEPKTVTP